MLALHKRIVRSAGVLLILSGFFATLAPSAVAASTPAPTATPTLTLTGVPATATAGTHVMLAADLGIPLAALQLSSMPAGDTVFTPLASLTADAAGSVQYWTSPRSTTTYRVEFAGDAGWAAASAETPVAVRPRLQFTATATVYQGQGVAFGVQVSPAHAGATVVLQIKRGDTWTPWRSLVLDAASRASSTWHSDRQGCFPFRTWMAADSGHVAGASGVHVVLVKNANPYHVPTASAHYIVVDISQYLLYYHEHGHIVRVFKCVTGRPSLPTPLGHFRIYAKDPHMSGEYGPRRMRYLGLYAIHGTNEPWLLRRFPRNYSHGCTRLANRDIVWLYSRCPVGTLVWNVP